MSDLHEAVAHISLDSSSPLPMAHETQPAQQEEISQQPDIVMGTGQKRSASPERNLEASSSTCPVANRTKAARQNSAIIQDGSAAKEIGSPTFDTPLEIIREEYDFMQGSGLCRCKLYSYSIEVRPEEVQAKFKPAPLDLAKSHWIRITYPSVGALEILAQHLERTFCEYLFDVTRVANTEATSLLLYKPDYKNTRKSLAIPGVGEPSSIEVALFPGGEGRTQAKVAQKRLVEEFQQTVGKHLSNMCVKSSEAAMAKTAASVLAQTKGMNQDVLEAFLLNIHFKKEENVKLAQLEQTLSSKAVENRIKEMRKLNGRMNSNVIYLAQNSEDRLVQPASVFKPSWRQLAVTIHNKSLLTIDMPRIGNTANKVTLETFINFQQLHQNIALFIPGKSRTGKSELAKHICMRLACLFQSFEDTKFVLVNTIDTLRNNQSVMRSGVPALLDDFGHGGSKDAQLIYSTVSMWKSILQGQNPSQNRGRCDDISWAARQPQVITTNCTDLEDWIGKMFPGCEDNHKEAIVLRVAEVGSITESLYVHATAPSGTQSYLQARLSPAEADALMCSALE